MSHGSMKDMLPDTMSRRSDPQSSRDAAKRIVPFLSDIQSGVLTAVRSSGTVGMTDLDLENHFGSHRSTYRSRRAELVEKKLIKDSGQKREQDGSRRTVWIAA